MKTVYKVKVVIKIGEIDSHCYADIETIDDGKDDNIENEMLFESVADFINWRIENQKTSTN